MSSSEETEYFGCYGCAKSFSTDAELQEHETICLKYERTVLKDKLNNCVENLEDELHIHELEIANLENMYEYQLAELEDDINQLKYKHTRLIEEMENACNNLELCQNERILGLQNEKSKIKRLIKLTNKKKCIQLLQT